MSEPRRRDPLPLGGEDLPFSKGLLARALAGTGLSSGRAYELALRAERDLAERGESVVELERLEELAVEVLGADDGERAVRRLRRYRDLQDLDVPIVILVGGATGTGKSTVATEVAHRLGITRVTSTDFVRQTMRAFFSAEFMPAIHYSSFEAAPAAARDAADPVLAGFLHQTRDVLVGVRAAIERALHEGWSMVMEGVHLVPGEFEEIEGALVLHVVLAIDDEETHERHFFKRDAATGGVRALQKYVDALGEIRRMQDYIVERARRAGVPVVQNENIDEAIDTVMELVFAAAERVEAVR